MKKNIVATLTLLYILYALLFQSCSKDKDIPLLVGTWETQSTHIKVLETSVVTFDTTYTLASDDIVITFNADNTFIAKPKDSKTETGTYNIDGASLQFNSGGEIDSFTYTLSKDEFRLINTSIHETDARNKTVETITYKRR